MSFYGNMAYVPSSRELKTPKILQGMGLSIEARRLKTILNDFALYLNSGRFKVLKLKRGYIEAIIKGHHGEWHTKVNLLDYRFSCSCPHHRFRKALCKHVLLLLELYAFLRNEARDLKLIESFLEAYKSRLF